MEGLVLLLNVISWVTGLASLACFIIILVKLFQNGDTGIAITSIITLFLCGIGGLIAFIFGWMKVDELDARKVMLIWTLIFIVNLIIFGIAFAIGFTQGMQGM